jgi:hypothetical protein
LQYCGATLISRRLGNFLFAWIWCVKIDLHECQAVRYFVYNSTSLAGKYKEYLVVKTAQSRCPFYSLFQALTEWLCKMHCHVLIHDHTSLAVTL